MRELNPVGREDNVLLLVSSDGEQFSVTVDETLLRTLKEHRLPDSSGVQLSPREIQDAIRSGETITEIAERSGTKLSLVERFAHPVIEELQHMVDLAMSIRVELPADRFNEIEKKPFGEVVEENLSAAGSSEVIWSAKRAENSVWLVSVNYALGDSSGSATWTFDPRRYQLTPETSDALALSTPGNTIDTPLRGGSKSVTREQPANTDPVVTTDKLDAFRSRRAKASEPDSSPEVITSDLPLESTPTVEPENLADVVQLTQVVEVIPEDLGEESQADDEKPNLETPKKSRAPMPSWDQIVRGTQSDDGEAF